jgi:hypothetical protein
LINTHVQIDKLIYFAILLKKCVDERNPKSDSNITRLFLNYLNFLVQKQQLKEGYSQNERSTAYLMTMSRELDIIYRNNKPTPQGNALGFFVPEEILTELPEGFKILFAKSFLLENYAFIKSLTEHMQQYKVIRDNYSWYHDVKATPENGLVNNAFSVYMYSLKIAYESSEGIGNQRRYLQLYRQAAKKGKTAKALFPKIKPHLGLMEDIGLLKKRKYNDNVILFGENNGHTTCTELMNHFQDYRVLNKVYHRDENLTSIILNFFGYERTKIIHDNEVLLLTEDLYTKLSDPVFNVCDLDTLVNILVVQKGIEGYRLSELEVKEIVTQASKRDRYKYQILPDRHGQYRFLKIKK